MTIDRVRSAACYVSLILVVLATRGAHAASTKMTYESPTSHCKFDVRFNPKRDDALRVSNTLDVAFGYSFAMALNWPISPNDPARWPNYRDEVHRFCTSAIKRVTELSTIDLAPVEEYRAMTLDQLRDHCDFYAVEAKAALGEPSALRDYNKSAPQCSRFIEALEGNDTKTVWHEVINAICQKNFKPDACRASSLSAETKPNAVDLIKLDLLTYGWQNCSVPYLLANTNSKRFEAVRAASEKAIRVRLRVRAHPCDL
jgi:hypothetical protein